MKFNIFILFSLMLVVFSCKKDQDTPQSQVVPEEGSISGKFGSDSFYFTFPFYDSNGNPDTMSNVVYSNGFISMVRNDATFPTKGIAMFLQSTGVESLPLNVSVPNCELQLNNYYCPADTTFGPNDSCNYYGSSFNQSVDIRITDKKDDILTGTFSGVINTKTGLSKQVTEGKFRIRLLRKQE